jgi:tetratricopeptide (TPR) repeat protein
MIASGSDPDSSMISGERARDVRTLTQANLALMQGRPIEADEHLQEVAPTEEVDSVEGVDPAGTGFQNLFPDLRSTTDTALFEYGIAAYDDEDYATAFDALHRIKEAGTGQPQERWYYQGMAAYQLERPEEARTALVTLRDYLTEEYPHFDAQAAYVLVQLLPTEEARPYAEHIASQYSDTIYNNSVVQAVLAES